MSPHTYASIAPIDRFVDSQLGRCGLTQRRHWLRTHCEASPHPGLCEIGSQPELQLVGDYTVLFRPPQDETTVHSKSEEHPGVIFVTQVQHWLSAAPRQSALAPTARLHGKTSRG